MADPWQSQVVEGRNLCPSCKSSSTLEIDGEVVDTTIEDGEAIVLEPHDDDDIVVCRECNEEYEIADDKGA